MSEKQQLFRDFEKHLMNDHNPSQYFNDLYENGQLQQTPFTMLSELKKIEQNPVYHPEGSVWNHTMLVVDNAAQLKEQSEEKRVLMWAALLHDIGKAPTTKLRNGKITSYDHDKVGKKMARKFLTEFTDDEEFITKVCNMIRWHMQFLFVLKGLPFAEIKRMKAEVPLLEIGLLALCDRLGRSNLTQDRVDQEKENLRIFLDKCNR